MYDFVENFLEKSTLMTLNFPLSSQPQRHQLRCLYIFVLYQ